MPGLRRANLCLVYAALACAAWATRASEAGGERGTPGEPPQENSSYVPDDDEAVLRAMGAAQRSAAANDWVSAVRALQTVVEGRPDAVLPVSEGGTFEGAWIVAQHTVARHGAKAFEAYEREFGPAARALLVAGVEGRDETALARAADRYLPSTFGRQAALLLADLASERGDADAALAWLERLQDLEDACAPDLATEAARWKEARLTRAAVALASDGDALPRVRAALRAGLDPAPDDLRRLPEPAGWPTTGGDASRSRTIPPLLGRFDLAWCEPLHESPAGSESEDEEARPSLWLPPRAVVEGDRVLVSDGRFLTVRELSTGRLVLDPVPLESPPSSYADVVGDRGTKARLRWGLLEGHALTATGSLVACAVPEPLSGRERREDEDVVSPRFPPPPRSPRSPRAADPRADEPPRGAHVVALRLPPLRERGGATIAWRAGGDAGGAGMPEGLRLHGAPLAYRGTLYVGGVRQTKASEDRWEAFVVALDPATGSVRFASFLGAGGPIRRSKDEVMSASCAAARGRVVCVTALGLVSAVDAATGRTHWAYRYDRGRPDGEAQDQRLSEKAAGPRRTTFQNEPPLLALDMCFFAPTDARDLYATFDRPRGALRHFTAWRHPRTEGFVNLALEHLVGCTDGRGGVPPTLVGVGKGWPVSGELHTCVVAIDPRPLTGKGAVRWGRPLPDGGPPEPYGRACLTEAEVYVPTESGIAGFRLADGEDLPFHDLASVDADRRLLLGRDRPFGNLVPVPGKGLIAVNEDTVAFWKIRQ